MLVKTLKVVATVNYLFEVSVCISPEYVFVTCGCWEVSVYFSVLLTLWRMCTEGSALQCLHYYTHICAIERKECIRYFVHVVVHKHALTLYSNLDVERSSFEGANIKVTRAHCMAKSSTCQLSSSKLQELERGTPFESSRCRPKRRCLCQESSPRV